MALGCYIGGNAAGRERRTTVAFVPPNGSCYGSVCACGTFTPYTYIYTVGCKVLVHLRLHPTLDRPLTDCRPQWSVGLQSYYPWLTLVTDVEGRAGMVSFVRHVRRKPATRRGSLARIARRPHSLLTMFHGHAAAVRCRRPVVQLVGHLEHSAIRNMEMLFGTQSAVTPGQNPG